MAPTEPYPLAPVRELRRQEEEQAARALAQLRAELAAARQALAAAREQVRAGRRQRAHASTWAATSGAELSRLGAHDGRLRAEQEARELAERQTCTKVSTLERALAAAELRLTRAYRERELIERHYERHVQAQRKQAEREAELESEDRAQSAAHRRS